MSRNDRNNLSLRVDPYVFEKVEEFKYLDFRDKHKQQK